MKSATLPDEIPAVHVLQAGQNQDRKETEDLLAGFDRPGRGPKAPAAERDFVDYYARKKNAGADKGSRPASAPPRAVGPEPLQQINVSTVVVPRRKAGAAPAWLGLVAAAALMLLVGGGVAYVATGDSAPSTSASPTSSGPSAATTITAATATPSAKVEEVPLPAPAAPSAVTVPAPAARPTTTRATPSARASAAAAPSTKTDEVKPPPRDDLVRDL